jgi:hypothetical protein
VRPARSFHPTGEDSDGQTVAVRRVRPLPLHLGLQPGDYRDKLLDRVRSRARLHAKIMTAVTVTVDHSPRSADHSS